MLSDCGLALGKDLQRNLDQDIKIAFWIVIMQNDGLIGPLLSWSCAAEHISEVIGSSLLKIMACCPSKSQTINEVNVGMSSRKPHRMLIILYKLIYFLIKQRSLNLSVICQMASILVTIRLPSRLHNCISVQIYISYKQQVWMHGHQGWNVRHGLCHIYMRCVYIYMSCL